MSVKIVAELGLNHNGNIDTAFKLILKAKAAGCDYVKFQKRTLSYFTDEEMSKPRESPWGSTYGQYRHHIEFGVEKYGEINAYCEAIDIKWFASVWDEEALNFISRFDTPYVKIPSALLTNTKLLESCKILGLPIILSTGMSTKGEVGEAIRTLGPSLCYLLQCTSSYPAPVEEINLRVIDEYQDLLAGSMALAGFSNHTPGLVALPAAVAMGAKMIEFHITLDRSMYGTDQASSIEDVDRAVRMIRQTERMLGCKHKEVMFSELPHIERLRR